MRLASILVLSLALPATAADAKGGEISGVVMLDGKPLAGATITFHPADKDQKPVAARTDADGKYRAAGVPAGECVVTITRLAPDPKDPTKKRNLLPAKYSDPKVSEIKVMITGQKQAYDVQLATR